MTDSRGELSGALECLRLTPRSTQDCAQMKSRRIENSRSVQQGQRTWDWYSSVCAIPRHFRTPLRIVLRFCFLSLLREYP